MRGGCGVPGARGHHGRATLERRLDPGSGDERDWAQEEKGMGASLGLHMAGGDGKGRGWAGRGLPAATTTGPGQALGGGRLRLAPHRPLTVSRAWRRSRRGC